MTLTKSNDKETSLKYDALYVMKQAKYSIPNILFVAFKKSSKRAGVDHGDVSRLLVYDALRRYGINWQFKTLPTDEETESLIQKLVDFLKQSGES